MEPRINFPEVAPSALEAMLGLSSYVHKCGLEDSLLNLVFLRASQVNGCAYCIDMHWKDARAGGETEQRLYGLDAWPESPYYSDRERAALAWVESLTLVSETHVPAEVFAEVQKHFSEKEILDLVYVASTINAWNRIAISMRAVPGRYQPAQKSTAAH